MSITQLKAKEVAAVVSEATADKFFHDLAKTANIPLRDTNSSRYSKQVSLSFQEVKRLLEGLGWLERSKLVEWGHPAFKFARKDGTWPLTVQERSNTTYISLQDTDNEADSVSDRQKVLRTWAKRLFPPRAHSDQYVADWNGGPTGELLLNKIEKKALTLGFKLMEEKNYPPTATREGSKNRFFANGELYLSMHWIPGVRFSARIRFEDTRSLD